MARYLVNEARTLIFSTGPAPPVVAAALTALDLVRDNPRRIERVRRNAQTLRDALCAQGLAVPPGETAIVPLVLGDAAHAVAVCEHALQRGVFAQAIRPPTVPEGSSRLRLAAMASHNAAELEWAAAQLGAAAREAGATTPARAARTATVFDHARAA
jgi:7-keto-8-aminopelargonate synthetase-like enzyme